MLTVLKIEEEEEGVTVKKRLLKIVEEIVKKDHVLDPQTCRETISDAFISTFIPTKHYDPQEFFR